MQDFKRIFREYIKVFSNAQIVFRTKYLNKTQIFNNMQIKAANAERTTILLFTS